MTYQIPFANVANFLAFAGERFYPAGGAEDLIGAFNELDEAVAACRAWLWFVDPEAHGSTRDVHDGWWHVFDITRKKFVAHGQTSDGKDEPASMWSTELSDLMTREADPR